MFAFLLDDSMAPFYHNISSFPTVFFTFLLTICLLFWLITLLGAIDIEAFDLPTADVGGEGGILDAAGGLMMKLGLNGVPVTIILSFIALFGWTISYNAVHYLHITDFSAPISWLANTAVFAAALFLAIGLTAQAIKPLRSLFNKMSQDTPSQVIGQVAIVRTSRVDDKFGEAEFDNGAAGFIFDVRATDGQVFKKNDRVVLLEYKKEQDAYLVISEKEFLNN